jgi:FtsP/CotA-like multicopper oxidase with cupredoxin domain
MSSAAGIFVDKNGVRLGNFGINNVTYRNQIGFPLIQQVQEGLQIDGDLVAHATFHEQGGGDIVINNLDAPISHPFHLHGKPFMIVARGQGNITKEQWEGIQSFTANTTNPLRRDVLQIPGGTWVVLRESRVWYCTAQYPTLPGAAGAL